MGFKSLISNVGSRVANSGLGSKVIGHAKTAVEKVKNFRNNDEPLDPALEGGEEAEDGEEASRSGILSRLGGAGIGTTIGAAAGQAARRPIAAGVGAGVFAGSVGASAVKAVGRHIAENWQVNVFFILTMLVHLMDSWTNYASGLRWLLYLTIVPFAGFFLVYRDPEQGLVSKESLKGIIKCYLLSGIALLIPVLLPKILHAFMGRDILNLILVLFPFYLIWFIFVEPNSPLLKTLQKIMIIFWFIIGFMAIFAAAKAGNLKHIPMLQSETGADIGGALSSLGNLIKNTWNNFWGEVGIFFGAKRNESSKWWGGMMNYSTGGEYYKGQEEQTEEEYGVFIRELEQSDPNVMENEPVTIWGFLEVKTPGEDKIDINMACKYEKEEGEESIIIEGVMSPEIVTSYGYDYIDFGCRFNDGFEKGLKDIIFTITYSFKTSSNIKTYFTEMETKNTYRREGMDILREHGIYDENPMAIYTDGPIHLGIDSPQLPIGIENNGEQGPRIGFTLENSWEGKIMEIEKLKLYIPNGLELDSSFCDYSFDELGQEGGFNVYEINKELGEEGIEDYLTLRCNSKVIDKTALLGGVPVSIKYIKVFVDYIFESEENIGAYIS